ncbi:MAG TPA: translocation/assembly module TamB domain-containing protein [Bdellovibrionales bacterium]|nr:translocation/assembly module TamB domain-containing protein [Bdellovibrionales bacterium]
MKRFALWLFAVLVALVIGLPLLFLSVPELLVNERNLGRVMELLPRFGMTLESDSRSVDVESKSLFVKRLRLGLTKPCFEIPKSVRACFEAFELDVTLTLYPFRLNHLKLLKAEGGDIELWAGPPSDEARPKSETNYLRYVRNMTWEKVAADVASFKYHLENEELSAQARAVAAGGDELKLEFSGSGGLAKANLKFSAAGQLVSGRELFASPWRSKAEAGVEGPGLKADIKWLSKSESDYPKFVLNAAYSNRKTLRAHVDWNGELDDVGVRGRVSGDVRQKRNLVQVRKEDPCTVAVRWSGFYEVSCPFRVPVNPRLMRIRLNVPVPDTVGLAVRARAEHPFPPDLKKPFKGDVLARLLLVETDAFRAQGEASAKFDFLASRLPEFGALDTKVDFNLDIFAFESLVRDLGRTEFAIPAPLNALKGNITVEVKEGRIRTDGGTLPFTWRTGLRSETQKFETRGNGMFELGLKPFKPKLALQAVIESVRLILPRVEWADLRSPPHLVPDSRIRRNGPGDDTPAKPKPSAFDYAIKVKSERPVELVSNLASQPIPIHVDLNVSKKEAMTGTVTVSRFPVILFRRDAQLTELRLTFNPKEEEDLIDGRAQVKYTDYTVYIVVSGPLNKPRIDIESTPPLPRRQLIATLVFGRPINELDSDQKSSVANLEGALKDGVLGYYSLYYLASTPVESVGYDPQSKMVTAKVRLQEGTSLNVGLNEDRDLGAIGVRRRLGRGWVLTTEVEDPFERGARNVSTYLEWLFRY